MCMYACIFVLLCSDGWVNMHIYRVFGDGTFIWEVSSRRETDCAERCAGVTCADSFVSAANLSFNIVPCERPIVKHPVYMNIDIDINIDR